jgi:hypothetical protein
MQRGSGLHSPAAPTAQSSSVVHGTLVRVQLLLGCGPREQSVPIRCPPQPLLLPPVAPVPECAARLRALPGQELMPKMVSGPSGLALGAEAVLPPPPT